MRINTKLQQITDIVSGANTDECIEAPVDKDKDGYGLLRIHYKRKRAHRVAYAIANGVSLESMDGLVVRHACDNPGCINPRHLDIGTTKDNIQDMISRGRGFVPDRKSGEHHPSAKLTLEQIEEARRLYKKGGRNNPHSYRGLAKKYGVTPTALRFAVIGKTWRGNPSDLAKS